MTVPEQPGAQTYYIKMTCPPYVKYIKMLFCVLIDPDAFFVSGYEEYIKYIKYIEYT